MNSTLNRLSLFAIKTQRYLPVAMMVFAMLVALISPLSSDGDGGTGL